MGYSAPFHRLVIIGNLYGDKFNTTLSIGPGVSGSLPAVSDTLLTNVATAVSTWWPKLTATSGGGCSIINAAQLTSIKLNRISVAGLYADPDAKEHVYTSAIPGGYAPTQPLAPQLTLVATLRGAAERALAGKGRMYLPPSRAITEMAGDGRVSTGYATYHAAGVRELIIALSDAYSSSSLTGVVGITSKVGSGAFQPVEKVTVGRVVDTMRSRRNKLAEDPQLVLI